MIGNMKNTTNIHRIGAMSFPWKADERSGQLSYQELKRGYRVIGGDKGDVLFDGYGVDDSGTELIGVSLRSSLDLNTEEANTIAYEIVEEAYASIGTECVEHS